MFKPPSVPVSELAQVHLELSELEAMRLCDLEGLDQTEAGARMGVSRGTIQRLLKRGRSKLVSALVGNAAIIIEEGEHDQKLLPVVPHRSRRPRRR